MVMLALAPLADAQMKSTAPTGRPMEFERTTQVLKIEEAVRELNEFFNKQVLRGGAHHGYIRIFSNGDDPDFDWNKGGRFYSQHFSTVEINHSFYRMPTERLLVQWAECVPGGFQFALKANQQITHIQKLRNCESTLKRFLEAASILGDGDHLGPILVQLPPTFRADLNGLEEFLKLRPRAFRFALEVRHSSWHSDAANANDIGVSLLCFGADADATGFPCITSITDRNVVITGGEIRAGRNALSNVVASSRIMIERVHTRGCVEAAGRVVIERKRTNGRVIASFDIGTEGLVSVSCVIGADDVGVECMKPNGRVIIAGGISIKTLRTVGRVLVASCCVKKGLKAGRGVASAGSVVFQRLITDSRIPDPGREAQQSVISFGRIAAGIASVWRWADRLRVLDERKADECKCN